MQRRLLIADGNDSTRQQLKQLLEADEKILVDTTGDGAEALRNLKEHSYSIVITDLRMPHFSGMQLIEEVQKRRLPVTVIVTTGFGGTEEAVQAMRYGAYDFLTKPIEFQHLRLVVERALRERTLLDEVANLHEQLQNRFSFQNMLSKSPRMHQVFELISRVAQTTSTVLIEGETGTGKEEVARAIHATSHVRTGPIIAVNCAALPENLLESELFGHEKGAFTSAVGQRQGRFELADGGTIFLDEVGDVPASMQAKLLRVLQERRFERVGGAESIEVDVRVIAATNRSLLRLVKQKTFREDLYYRLNVIKIDLPPLRDRPEDIPLLATHFIQKYARPGEIRQLSPHAMDLLLHYRWPGNIRELENAIERASVTCRDDTIRPENLPTELVAPTAPRSPFAIDLGRPLPDIMRDAMNEIEELYIREALKKSHGNIGRCARICGLSRSSISAKIAEYHIIRHGNEPYSFDRKIKKYEKQGDRRVPEHTANASPEERDPKEEAAAKELVTILGALNETGWFVEDASELVFPGKYGEKLVRTVNSNFRNFPGLKADARFRPLVARFVERARKHKPAKHN